MLLLRVFLQRRTTTADMSRNSPLQATLQQGNHSFTPPSWYSEAGMPKSNSLCALLHHQKEKKVGDCRIIDECGQTCWADIQELDAFMNFTTFRILANYVSNYLWG